MAIGTTGSDGNIQEFSYTPVDPQDDMIRQLAQQSQQAFYPPPPQPRGPTPYWENPETYYPQQQQIDPIAQAKAATMAAQKFIAFRGYQQDLKEGVAAADAFAKWGPMLVADTSFGPSMKAMTQPKPYTFNPQTNAYESPSGGRPVFGPKQVEAPRWIPANPTTGEPAHYESGGRAQFPPSPSAPKIDPLTLADYKMAEGEFKNAMKVYTDPEQPEEVKMEARKRMDAAKTRIENIRGRSTQTATAQAAPAAPAPKQPSAPTTPVVIRLTKDGKKAEFDASTKKFLRYAE